MTPPAPRHRLLAIALMTLLISGGVFAGAMLRPAPVPDVLPAATTPEAREAVRQATSLSEAFIAISEVVTPSVVRIEVERTVLVREERPLTGGIEDLFGRAPGTPQMEAVPQLGGGTGFIVSSDGYILTNNHVIAGADRITVTLRDKRVLDAQVVGADPTTDVAVIRVAMNGLPAVSLGDSDSARVGEWVLAVGNPGFTDASTLDFTVTGGIISAKGRPLNVLNAELQLNDPASAQYAIEDFIQTDAVINPGNSGGPLIDLSGTVIGINTAIASTTGYSQGYGFAIPSNLARRVMSDLIEHGYVRRPLLGISIADVTPEDAEVYRLPAIGGVVLEDFPPASPAYDAGMRRHDVIIAIDGTPVDRVGQLQRIVALRQPGDVVPVSVIRYGEPHEFMVRLMEGENGPRVTGVATPQPRVAGVGLELEALTPVVARQLGYAEEGGVIVSRVVPGSAAERKQVGANHRIREIDGDAVRSLDDARVRLERVAPGSVVSLLLEYPDGRTYIANVRVPALP